VNNQLVFVNIKSTAYVLNWTQKIGKDHKSLVGGQELPYLLSFLSIYIVPYVVFYSSSVDLIFWWAWLLFP